MWWPWSSRTQVTCEKRNSQNQTGSPKFCSFYGFQLTTKHYIFEEALECELGSLHRTGGFEGSQHKRHNKLKHMLVARPESVLFLVQQTIHLVLNLMKHHCQKPHQQDYFNNSSLIQIKADFLLNLVCMPLCVVSRVQFYKMR
ncbi:uncharacterized protein [Gossypium hirsutum]|uniref:Uncharacterized protein n=1 Tax=Gossypium hirsutum TaxID=3635 RepID=A0ABM3BV44_GOSHI|nr:uncharacterized protein LOC107944774 [Gossypium hirsutum]XP_040970924.1 uncharacterized protein LOC121230368 [Gossypium hirsutum]